MHESDVLLKEALLLKPQDRFMLIEALIQSLDKPDEEIDTIWAEEAQKRLIAHRLGKTKSISFKEVFGEEL